MRYFFWRQKVYFLVYTNVDLYGISIHISLNYDTKSKSGSAVIRMRVRPEPREPRRNDVHQLTFFKGSFIAHRVFYLEG